VSFSEIKNLSFWGEDRHFCIRAAALGLSLYVDTNYPAYHIYRESDLEGVWKYKEICSNRSSRKTSTREVENQRFKNDLMTNKGINKKRISLVYTNLSGSNTLALYKMADQYIKDKYDISLVFADMSNKYLESIVNSDIAIFTEGNY